MFLLLLSTSHLVKADTQTNLPAPTFTIPQKNTPTTQSKNGLKEDLGDELEQLHAACSTLSKEIARIQFAVAKSQELLVKEGKTLLNNQPPYKKATKRELEAIKQKFSELTKEVNQLAKSLSSSKLNELPCKIVKTKPPIKKTL